jgi:leucyl aminopeptidase
MKIITTTQKVQDVACDALIVGSIEDKQHSGMLLTKTATVVDEILGGLLTECGSTGEFKGALGEMLTIHPMGKLAAKRVIVVGLGNLEKVDTQAVRRATEIATNHLQSTGAQHIALAVEGDSKRVEMVQGAQAEVEGAILGLYTFQLYQSEKQAATEQVSLLAQEQDQDSFTHAIQRAQALADATNFARSLVNEPPNVLTPAALAQRAKAMAKEVGIECEIFDKTKIAELGMGGLLGVSQGSSEPPYFIILRYRGAAHTEQGMALVGKGITFDTGGISLKPAEGMDEMKGDMGGAAAVIGAMQAIAHLQPAINVTALIPTCENRPGATAYLPGDVLKIMNGKTIEIVNTDAEGRLVLADALSYASRAGLSPIIDVATLTGGIVVALGSTMTGLFCNDGQLTNEIIAAGRTAGEKFWPMPLDDEYGAFIKSDIADIKQTAGRPASSVTAAKILENFVDNAKWAHLDIAGTSYVEQKKPYQEKGGTGVGVRTLAELALQLAQK